MVDIIVVSYNHSNFLEECLNSIKNQTYKNFKLQIYDDASPDHSVEVISKWIKNNPDLNVSFYPNQENIGLCRTLNKALENCTSDYVKIIAADDYLHPEYLKKNISLFKKLDETAKIIFSKAYFVDENSEILKDKTYYLRDYSNVDISNELFKHNFISAPSVILRRDIYKLIGNYDPNVILEDYDTWLKALKAGVKFKFLDEVLTYYRHHGSNQTSTRRRRIHEESLALRIKSDTTKQYKKVINKSMITLYLMYPDLKNSNVFKDFQNYGGKNKMVEHIILKNKPHFFAKTIKLFLNAS